MELHPIMYVPDQYSERDFYRALGFADHYEGDEFPGFLAMSYGETVFGLERADEDHPRYREGLRWQFELPTHEELSALIELCAAQGLPHDVIIERGTRSYAIRILRVESPSGVRVWFEGPNTGG